MIESLTSYRVPAVYMDRLVALWGQPVTVFIPSSFRELGYENQSPSRILDQTGVPSTGTTFERWNTEAFIDFKVQRRTLYHFNWFPQDADELCTAFFKFSANVGEGAYVRTAQLDNASKWGDLLFRVVKVMEDGRYQALKRYHFLRPVVGSELHNLLELGPRGSVVIAPGQSDAVPYGVRPVPEGGTDLATTV